MNPTSDAFRFTCTRSPGLDVVHDPPLALVQRGSTAFERRRSPLPRSHLLFGIAGLVSIGIFLAGLPLVSMGVIAATAIASLTLGSLVVSLGSHEAPMVPEAIVSIDLRETYRGILIARDELDRVIADAPHLQDMNTVRQRCAAAIAVAGRMARLSNPLQLYLDAHDPVAIRAELDRLHARAEATTDERAVAALGHAVAARARQLAIRDELAANRDRIHARLELVRAALEAFAASIVKLQVTDEEQLAEAGETIAGYVEGAAEDLEVVEATLGELAA